MKAVNPTFGWIFTVLLVVTTLLPAGMMPSSKNLTLDIRFCSENPLLKMQTIVIERDVVEHHGEKDDSCPFAALAHSAGLLPLNAAPLMIWRGAIAADLPPSHIAPGMGLAAPPPFATGPPFA